MCHPYWGGGHTSILKEFLHICNNSEDLHFLFRNNNYRAVLSDSFIFLRKSKHLVLKTICIISTIFFFFSSFLFPEITTAVQFMCGDLQLRSAS